MAKVTKRQKYEWHNSMRQRACDYSQGICGLCKKTVDVKTGVIHHSAYPPGVYEIDVEVLINEKICVWLCKECHEKVHYTDKIENSGAGKLNAGKCHICDEICYGGWDRAKTLGIDKCICKKCYRANKKRTEAIKKGQTSFFP
jgi:hypothetical protein